MESPTNDFDAEARQWSKWNEMAQEIDTMGEQIRRSASEGDFKQLKKFEFWGRLSTGFGYATAWIVPNPISAFLISQGNYARWSLVFHVISHGAMDRVPGIPMDYTSKKFAQGFRRYRDWLDWMTPANWHIEHNHLHHYHLGTSEDPDVLWRNTAFIRNLKAPLFIRYGLAFIVACFWKPFYYAPNTLIEARFQKGLSPTKKITGAIWNPFTEEGRILWMNCLLPYFIFRFVFLPGLFLPLGMRAWGSVLINSMLAEVLTNLHSFAAIGPNHTGNDIYTFEGKPKNRGEFYLRQILGTVNYASGTDFTDFLFGGMNYQIEHHLWPTASLSQCKRARPFLQALCKKYQIPYNEFRFLPRVWKTFQVMAGGHSNLGVGRLGCDKGPENETSDSYRKLPSKMSSRLSNVDVRAALVTSKSQPAVSFEMGNF